MLNAPPAHPSLNAVIRPTTIIQSSRLNRALGLEIILASETFQHTGSFKFRAAYNVVAQIPNQRLITASSGNFGQALAYACALTGKSCIVVMPANSAQVKIEAVREYGGQVDLIDTASISRSARVAQLAGQFPDAYVASAYDDAFVIAGNASLGAELARLDKPLDFVVAPIGGGGLISGLITGLSRLSNPPKIIGAEPTVANDASRSLQAGRIISNEQEPQTIADGVRTLSVGQQNWTIIRQGVSTVVEVPEEKIREAVRLLFHLANLKVEPTGALSLAALLTRPELFKGGSACCVVTGGNVDPDLFVELIGPINQPCHYARTH